MIYALPYFQLITMQFFHRKRIHAPDNRFPYSNACDLFQIVLYYIRTDCVIPKTNVIRMPTIVIHVTIKVLPSGKPTQLIEYTHIQLQSAFARLSCTYAYLFMLRHNAHAGCAEHTHMHMEYTHVHCHQSNRLLLLHVGRTERRRQRHVRIRTISKLYYPSL